MSTSGSAGQSPDPKWAAPSPREPDQGDARRLALEAALLEELQQTNRLLSTYIGRRRFTLAFLAGITRGLGAMVGATVVFALAVGALSYLDTTPFIGNYVRQVLDVVQGATRPSSRVSPPSTGSTGAADSAPDSGSDSVPAPAAAGTAPPTSP